MSEEAFIFDLTEETFPQAALLNSHKVPVVVEFLASWSGPCFGLADRFIELAREFPGQFVFARVDIDEQKALLKEYAIENVPTTMVFRNGECVRTEEGEMSGDEARALLRDFGVFRESDELREQAREQHLAGNTAAAVGLLTQAAQSDPGNVRIAMDMVQIFIDVGQADEARALLNRIPEAQRESENGKALAGQLLFLELATKTEGIDILTARLAEDADDHNARFDLAVCDVARHDLVAAMQHLLRIHEAEPTYREGAARELLITLINMLAHTDPTLAADYRRRLGNLING